jgi:A/G-specific adenine glycosylase
VVQINTNMKKKLSAKTAPSNQEKTGKPSSGNRFTPLEMSRAKTRGKLKNSYTFSRGVNVPCESPLTGFMEEWATKGFGPILIRKFQKIILQHYEKHARAFPWRRTREPYQIFVSEIMLQQTQVDRVIEKYEKFIVVFPDVFSLARAPLEKVLKAWLGLGYNRRAIALKKSAEIVVKKFKGKLPEAEKELLTLPGVGKYTAAAISVFAFNHPVVLLETNVRTVFIRFFFSDQNTVTDQEIIPFIEKTLDRSNPRRWYNALMDYGVMLKKNMPNPGRKSAHYTRQSRFEGSDRQIRGAILRALAVGKSKSVPEIIRRVGSDPDRTKKILLQLQEEGFVTRKKQKIMIA